jgi:hypothetical protein
MSTPPSNCHGVPTEVSARYAFLRHLNTNTLAVVLFVALALLSTTRGKDAETLEPASTGSTKSEIVVDKQHDDVPNVVTKSAGQTMSPPPTLWQFIGRIIDAFKGALNDPSLIEYANQLGIGIADSSTAPRPDTSGQPLAPSKSP